MRAFSQIEVFRKYVISFVLLVSAFAGGSVYAQSPQELSLADLLIGLRSKKATLPERNQILAGAVVDRGITFSLTPEIEKELMNTGADNGLIQAIKTKSVVIPTASAVPPKTEQKPAVTPVSTPPQPDAAFYRKRADSYLAKGDFDLAIVELNHVIEMKGDDASAFIGRATAYAGRNRYDLAIGDLDKAIQIDPKQSIAYLNRGDAYEKSGNKPKAMEDYQKAVDLDGANEQAKSGLKRLQPETAKVEPKPVDAPPAGPQSTPPNTAADIPDFVNLGQITGAKLLMPAYPASARQLNIQGKVVVQVNLDEEGKVVSAKATAGPIQLRAVSEEAARRSKFSPNKIGDKPVKATGYVVYNFVS